MGNARRIKRRDNWKMKWSKLKNSSGFEFTWGILALYSSVMYFFDWKLGIMGFIICGLFGFLGFDMMETVANNLGRKGK